MQRQLVSIGLLLLTVVVFIIPELVVLPNLQAEGLYWPYLMSMFAASVVIHLVGREANKEEVRLQILNIRFERWALIIAVLSVLVYCAVKTDMLLK